MTTIGPDELLSVMAERLARLDQVPRAVTGPGRSGAIASAMASHMLGIPFVPYGQPVTPDLRPLLIIDTAAKTGRTLRKAAQRYHDGETIPVALYQEPPRVRFWYEFTRIDRCHN